MFNWSNKLMIRSTQLKFAIQVANCVQYLAWQLGWMRIDNHKRQVGSQVPVLGRQVPSTCSWWVGTSTRISWRDIDQSVSSHARASFRRDVSEARRNMKVTDGDDTFGAVRTKFYSMNLNGTCYTYFEQWRNRINDVF